MSCIYLLYMRIGIVLNLLECTKWFQSVFTFKLERKKQRKKAIYALNAFVCIRIAQALIELQ